MGSILKQLVMALTATLIAAPAMADPSAGPWTNLQVCIARGGRAGVKVVSDGRGGAIIGWYDQRNESTPSKLDVYVQRINAGGISSWTPDGVVLCGAPGEQYNVVLASDGEGGAVAAWSDFRDPLGYVYAQRVDARGDAAWAVNGISVSPARMGVNPRVESDRSGGALVAWEVLGGSGRAIYAQHVSSTGQLLWGIGGVAICTVPGFHSAPNLVSDGAGGAIVFWTDVRDGARIYAQHVNSSGNPVWNVDGVPVCDFPSDQRGGTAVSDGDGGAIVTWRDSRKPGPKPFGLFTQRLNSLGQRMWDAMGVDLCDRPLSDDLFVVACANRGGAIFCWHDRRSGDYDIRAQSVTAAGRALWEVDGSLVCGASGDQLYPAITADEAGGAFVTWQDYRDPSGGVYVQHVSESGKAVWDRTGAAVSVSSGYTFPTIAGDGRGGAFVSWTDDGGTPAIGRDESSNIAVLAERLTDATHGRRVSNDRRASRSSVQTLPSMLDEDAFSATLSLPLSGSVHAVVFDVTGRRVRSLPESQSGPGDLTVSWNGRDDMGHRVMAGLYFVRVRAAGKELTFRAVVAR